MAALNSDETCRVLVRQEMFLKIENGAGWRRD